MVVELNIDELKQRLEAGESLRTISSQMGISYGGLRHRLGKLGLQTVQAQRFVSTPGFRGSRIWTQEQLIEYVGNSKTVAEVIRKLGLSNSAGNWRTIKKHIERLHLDTSHFLGQGWVSDPARKSPNRRELTEVLIKGSTYTTSAVARRIVREGLKQYICEGEGCGLTEWFGKPLSLELDHINGIHNDHRLENLRFLCPNCHAQTETWRGRNKRLNSLAAAAD